MALDYRWSPLKTLNTNEKLNKLMFNINYFSRNSFPS